MSNISHNDFVVIRMPSDALKIVTLKPEGVISLGKFGSFEVDGIVGYPFGTSFEIIDNKKVRTIKGRSYETNEEEEEAAENLKNVGNSESNKNLMDIGHAVQKMGHEEIEALKASGDASSIGQKIIESMIANHENFDKKTIFSQEKYLKRKQQKFLREFTVERVTSSNLLQYYIDKDSQKVLDMSEETLGHMMSLGNIQPGGNYLVVDETGGLVVFALLERMNNQGSITVLTENEHPSFDALKYTTADKDAMVKTISLLEFFEPPVLEELEWHPDEAELAQCQSSYKKEAYYKRLNWYNKQKQAIELASAVYDGLICVSTLNIADMVPRMTHAIGGSRPVVCYSQFKEVLVELAHVLYKDLRYLAPTVMQSKCRPYQTIPGRMHPVMTMRGGGGYSLWAHRVFPVEGGVTAVGRGIKRNQNGAPVERKETEAGDAA